MCLINEIFYNQLFQLCLISEIAAKQLYFPANDSREQLMGTGESFVIVLKTYISNQADPMSGQPLTFRLAEYKNTSHFSLSPKIKIV